MVTTLAAQGVIVVLATSASEDELGILLGLLDSHDAIHATRSADYVDVAKPEPDIERLALDRTGVAPAEAVFMDDSVWNMTAATRAGVQPFGMPSGGTAAQLLVEAGAAETYENTADPLARSEGLGIVD